MTTTGNPRASHSIQSFEDARRQVGFILAEINANRELAIAAAANPLFALEDLGYEIAPGARAEIEDHIRFGAAKAARLKRLRATIYKTAGREFDLQSAESLREVLEQLDVPLSGPGSQKRGPKQKCETPPALNLARSPQVKWAPRVEDPLEQFRGMHRIVEALLEYRKIEASEPRLATRALYDEIRQGKLRTPLVSVQGVLRTQGG
jgi:hypothetical protein